MGVAGLLAAVAVTSFGSHLVFHAVAYFWGRAQRRRRELGLRRLDELTRQIHALKRAPVDAPTWKASAYRHYSVPAGLRLGHARRVVREGREPPGRDAPA